MMIVFNSCVSFPKPYDWFNSEIIHGIFIGTGEQHTDNDNSTLQLLLRYRTFVGEIDRSPMDFPHKMWLFDASFVVILNKWMFRNQLSACCDAHLEKL